MMSDEDRGYHLPTPDMNVFGTPDDDPPTERHQPGGPSGTMRFQDEHTTPRPPTLAEQRARQAAEEELAARQAQADARSAGRRRVMIGTGVTVGVAALVGAWYLLASPATVSAQCTVAGTDSESGTIVADQNCDPTYAGQHGGYVNNGFVFLPLPGGGYRQYHYYYGGTPGAIGQRATGGSFTAPSNATVRTPSGKTIQRGGFGITGKTGGSGGEDGGGRSGGS
jgi:hypothetical protein